MSSVDLPRRLRMGRMRASWAKLEPGPASAARVDDELEADDEAPTRAEVASVYPQEWLKRCRLKR